MIRNDDPPVVIGCETIFAEVSTKSRGLDDLSASLLKEDLSGHIEQLHHDLIKGRYRPEPLKRITIE